MFKTLIKKVREESNNVSILSENNSSDEINGYSNKEQIDDDTVTTTRFNQRSNSSTSINKSRNSFNLNESERKDEESIKTLSDIFAPFIDETISIDNFIQILKTWIESKEMILQNKDEIIQRLIEESKILADQTIELRSKLFTLQNSHEKTSTENTNKMPYLQKQIDTLRSENETLKFDMKSLRKQLNDVEIERDDLLIKSTDIKSTDDLQRQLAKQKIENEQYKFELEKLRQALIERDAIIEQQDQRLLVDHETQAIQTDEDKSFVQILAEPDVDTFEKLQAELDEKNRTIKNLQQRYNDLRKTLQREFHASIPKDLNQMGSSKLTTNTSLSSTATNLPLVHYDSSSTSQSDIDTAKRSSITTRQMTAIRKNVTFTTAPSVITTTTETNPAVLSHTSVDAKLSKNGHRSSTEGQSSLGGTNFKYLKHVLLKFMTATEDEAIHLIRAVSTLLNLSADEERLLRETLDYKMSWFGKMSRHRPV